LINDILDLSKIEADQMEVEHIRCSPHLMISEVASMLRPRAEEKGISLEVSFGTPLPAAIESDPTRIRQLLTNLVGNAIKFTDSGGVHVFVRMLDSGEKPMLTVDVIDTGVGIPNGRLGNVFDPFVQADTSTSRKFGGTGLGLAISKRIAEALGGGLTACSDEGSGSTFTFAVETGPLDGVKMLEGSIVEALSRRESLSDTDHRPTLHGRILVVDDGETNRKLITLVLRRAGLKVTTAENGRIAVDLATTDPFDVILMDMQMPVMDGYTATRALRERDAKLPIIALTANAMRGEEEKCTAAGCSGYLSKPVDADRLLRMLAEVLGNATESLAMPEFPLRQPLSEGPAIVSTLPTDDPEFREIVEEFVERLSDQLEAMRRAWETDDLIELARLAHWLKGAGGTVGFDAFTEPAAKLEQLSKEEQLEQIESAIADLVELAGRIVVGPADAEQATSF
ncbi:MAG: response regulator, partial [Phycisphaerae bacterium]|nr:response regulator [Phycisphaerae bacterium]